MIMNDRQLIDSLIKEQKQNAGKKHPAKQLSPEVSDEQFNYEAAKHIGEEVTTTDIREYLTSAQGKADILALPAIAALKKYADITNKKKMYLWTSMRSKHIENFIKQIKDPKSDGSWLDEFYKFNGHIGRLIRAKTQGYLPSDPDTRLALVKNLQYEIISQLTKVFGCNESFMRDKLEANFGLIPTRGSLSDPDLNISESMAQKLGEELIHIFQYFYLARFKINYSNTTSNIQTNLTKLANLLDDSQKIKRPANNAKIKAAEQIITDITGIIHHDSLDTDEKKLNCIEAVLKELKEKYGKGEGKFAQAINYAWTYFMVYTQPLPTETLMRESDEFQFIEYKFRNDVLAKQNHSMRFEPARIANPNKLQLTKNIFKEMIKAPPSFGGKDEFIYIQKIESLKNDKLLEAYHNAQSKILTDLTDSKLEPAPVGVYIEDLSDNLNPYTNEVFLYHGTNLAAAYSIMQNGFNCERFCKFMTGNGYGPLGRGTYFTDELAKAGTFALCSLCKESRCLCKTVDNRPLPKVTIINKVVLGNPEVITEKSNEVRNSKHPEKEYHSRIGLAGNESEFSSNEVAIADDNQIYPQYLVFYHHYKNLLKHELWLQESDQLKQYAPGTLYSDITQQVLQFDKISKQEVNVNTTKDLITCLRTINAKLSILDLDNASIATRQFVNIFRMQIEFNEKNLMAKLSAEINTEQDNNTSNNNNNIDNSQDLNGSIYPSLSS